MNYLIWTYPTQW